MTKTNVNVIRRPSDDEVSARFEPFKLNMGMEAMRCRSCRAEFSASNTIGMRAHVMHDCPDAERLMARASEQDEQLRREAHALNAPVRQAAELLSEQLSMNAKKEVGGHSQAHEAAYRRRAGMIGILQSCICLWPIEREDTKTGHHEACPAHLMLTAKESA